MVKKRRLFSFGSGKPLFKRRPKPKKKPKSIWIKKKGDLYARKFNVYSYDQRGRARKIKTFNDEKEADSWVANLKAVNPNAVYKIVPEVKKKGW